MYSAIDAAGIAEASAEKAVMDDRLRYAPFFEAAERVAHDRGMTVGGDAGVLLLLGHELGPDDFLYEFFSDGALADARALADAVYAADPGGLGHYANMRTNTPQKDFTITVDERPLFRVKALAVVRDARSADVVVPTLRPAYFAKDSGGEPLELQCMGAELQLIGVYAALTNPARASGWERLLRVEDALRKLFVAETRGKFAHVVGGGRAAKKDDDGEDGPDADGEDGPADAATPRLVAALQKEYVPRSGHVVVGTGGRLQLVSANRFSDEEAAVGKIARRLGFRVQSASNDPKVPTDARLRRMTFYNLRPGARREPFLDIYNAGEYEVVPFVGPSEDVAGGGTRGREKAVRRRYCPPSGERVGTFFVRLRFLLVDMWTVQLLFRLGAASAGYARQVLEDLLTDFDAVSGEYVRARDAPGSAGYHTLFPPDPCQYIGRYEDPAVHQKRARQCQAAGPRGKQTTHFPYYPARKGRAAQTVVGEDRPLFEEACSLEEDWPTGFV